MQINSAKDLTVYKRAYELAMRIFRVEQELSGGREIRLNWSNSSLVKVSLFEPA
jgi:hypothetical protein